MKNNYFAIKTLRYIWFHPNSRKHKIASTIKFFLWQINKRLTHKNTYIQLIPGGYKDSASTSTVYYRTLRMMK